MMPVTDNTEVTGAKKTIAIIPARGGSKGLPGKNIITLCGKPLIVWTIESALESNLVDKVVVSTDSREIANIAKSAGADVPFMRPDELATDEAKSIDVVRHALGFYENEKGMKFDYMALLEPTSPLREKDDIDNMITALNEKSDDFDAIISLGEVNEHPSAVKKINGNTAEPFCADLPRTTRRQENEKAYFPYGVAYISKVSTLLDEGTFYPKRTTHHLIKRYQNYEIDCIYDLLAIENIMRHKWGLK